MENEVQQVLASKEVVSAIITSVVTVVGGSVISFFAYLINSYLKIVLQGKQDIKKMKEQAIEDMKKIKEQAAEDIKKIDREAEIRREDARREELMEVIKDEKSSISVRKEAAKEYLEKGYNGMTKKYIFENNLANQ